MTAHIPVPVDLAFRLLDETSRHRALQDDETDLLEALITRGHKSTGIRIRWTPSLDRALWKVSYRKGAIRQFARDNGISENACYNRLVKLRKRKAAREGKSTTRKDNG